MNEILTEEHQKLKQQLDTVLSQARENELKMQRFQAQELRLIGTRSLAALVQNILYNYRSAFALDAVSLVLYDPQYEIQRILEEEGTRLDELSNLIFITDRRLMSDIYNGQLYGGESFGGESYGGPISPQLGVFNPSQHSALFAESIPRLRSVALLPLLRYGELIGSFNLGSINEQRFTPASATDFLERLSTIVAICIENTTNHDRLKRVGLTDGLTGVNNRRFFDQRVGEEVARALRTHEPLACAIMDIDHFKQINDLHGHQAGDQILRQIAALISEQLRNSDVLARYGGEEFAAVLPGTNARSAFEIAERIREAIACYQFTVTEYNHTLPLSVTISIGIAIMGENTIPTEVEPLMTSLIKQADTALYDAKNSGRNCVVLTDEPH
jgi:diguanylate cyclase (GGDEF)-like protein